MQNERPNLWRALAYLIFAPGRYALYEAGLNEASARATDPVLRKHLDDPERAPPLREQWLAVARGGCTDVRGRLLLSFLMTAAVCCVAMIAAQLLGVELSRTSITLTKACNLAGAALVAWATLFGLGTVRMFWDGPPLSDQVVPLAFRIIFLHGVALIAVGAVL